MPKNTKVKDKYNIDEEIIIGYNTKKDKPKNSKKNNNAKSSKNNKNKKNNKKNPKSVKSEKTNKKQKKTEGFIQAIKIIFKVIITILVSVCVILFLFVSPVFSIQQIVVNGAEKLNESVYISLSNIQIGQNIFELNKTAIKDAILEEPYVENVEIKRTYPNKVEINVTEREVSYLIEYFGQYIYLDRNGYILEKNSELLNFPIIRGYETDMQNIEIGGRISENDLSKFNDLIKITDSLKGNNITAKLTSVDISNDEDYILEFAEEGKKVNLGNTKELSAKMAWINLFISEEKNKKGTIYLNSSNVYFSEDK